MASDFDNYDDIDEKPDTSSELWLHIDKSIDLSQLNRFKVLDELRIVGTVSGVDVSGLHSLNSLTKLQYLSMDFADCTEIPSLKNCTLLREVSLGKCKISAAELPEGVRELTLYQCDFDICSIPELKKLSLLSVIDTVVGQLPDMSGMTELLYVKFTNCRLPSKISRLTTVPNLEELKIVQKADSEAVTLEGELISRRIRSIILHGSIDVSGFIISGRPSQLLIADNPVITAAPKMKLGVGVLDIKRCNSVKISADDLPEDVGQFIIDSFKYINEGEDYRVPITISK